MNLKIEYTVGLVVQAVATSLSNALSILRSNPTWDNTVFFVSVSYLFIDKQTTATHDVYFQYQRCFFLRRRKSISVRV